MITPKDTYDAEKAHKILGPVPYDQGFHFYTEPGHYTGVTSTSLCSFLRDIGNVEAQSVLFHFKRGDFQKWITKILGDEELSKQIDALNKESSEEILRQQITDLVQKRISQLQLTS
jgi:alpha-amylase